MAIADDIALSQQVHARDGYVPIHVKLVTEQPVRGSYPPYQEVRQEKGTSFILKYTISLFPIR
jgi:hypothetical protein